MNSVGDIGGNIGDQLDSIQKLAGDEYCLKLKKEFRFQVIYTSNISYLLEFTLDI